MIISDLFHGCYHYLLPPPKIRENRPPGSVRGASGNRRPYLDMLRDAPELEAKTLFEHFLARPGSGLEEGHLRTFQRRVRHWHATQGAEQEVFFAQERKPGELMQLDWTYARELNVTIHGELLDHLLCHCVLPYSNWEWATRCLSESFLSLVSGLQAALVRLGKSPPNLGTDNTSAATHDLEEMPRCWKGGVAHVG